MAIDNQNLNYIDVSGSDCPAMFDFLTFSKDLPLLRQAGQVHLALPPHPHPSHRQHHHVRLHHLLRLQKQVNLLLCKCHVPMNFAGRMSHWQVRKEAGRRSLTKYVSTFVFSSGWG